MFKSGTSRMIDKKMLKIFGNCLNIHKIVQFESLQHESQALKMSGPIHLSFSFKEGIHHKSNYNIINNNDNNDDNNDDNNNGDGDNDDGDNDDDNGDDNDNDDDNSNNSNISNSKSNNSDSNNKVDDSLNISSEYSMQSDQYFLNESSRISE